MGSRIYTDTETHLIHYYDALPPRAHSLLFSANNGGHLASRLFCKHHHSIFIKYYSVSLIVGGNRSKTCHWHVTIPRSKLTMAALQKRNAASCCLRCPSLFLHLPIWPSSSSSSSSQRTKRLMSSRRLRDGEAISFCCSPKLVFRYIIMYLQSATCICIYDNKQRICSWTLSCALHAG
jgi:hypothetical protein